MGCGSSASIATHDNKNHLHDHQLDLNQEIASAINVKASHHHQQELRQHIVNGMRMENTNKVRQPIQLSKETLQQYLDLEQAIHDGERRQTLNTYQMKQEQLEQTKQVIHHLSQIKRNCRDEIVAFQQKSALVQDYNSLKEFISKKAYKENTLTPEESDFLQLLNKEEIIKTELETNLQMESNAKQEIEQLAKETESLQQLYKRRDMLLDSIFEGHYGSDLENKLEKDLDVLLEQKHHIDRAFYRWNQAQILTKEACRMLSAAIQDWKSLQKISAQETERRYVSASEARNKLLLACQNMQTAQNFLANIRLPYCTPEEVETLEKAISYIFTDMQTEERFQHALSCYEVTFKRVAALRQWLEQVINSTIARDQLNINDECKLIASELRNERIRLIRQRIKDQTGQDVDSIGDTSLEMRGSNSGVDSELEESASDEQLARLFESRSERPAASLTPDPTKMPFAYPTPLPTAELAPMPTNEEIFGKIEQLRNRHKQEIMDYQRAQKLNQMRMMQGLREKLMERRHRRSRMEMHNRELQSLSETP